MTRFTHFIAIDWSGAVGPRHKAIAVAVADAAGGPPVLVERNRGWNREEVLALLRDDLPPATLVGLDLGISLPFEDCGAFFPGWDQSPPDARSLWKLVDHICRRDPHLAASSFVDHSQASAYFRRHGGREGSSFGGGRGRFRVTEVEQAKMGCKPYSNFNLVGAAQVGKSSLTGMRMLHGLRGHMPVWPVDPLPEAGPAIVEIYTSLAAIAAGRTASRAKMRSFEELNAALATLDCPSVASRGPVADHASDALVTAAWLRNVANDTALWSPRGMTEKIARTEGWTFGVP